MEIIKLEKGKSLMKEKIMPTRLSEEKAQSEIGSKIDIGKIHEKIKAEKLFFEQAGTIESLARLVLELKNKIQKYDSILSDDAGGRIPSLILKRLIDKKREKGGRSNSKIYFLAGGHHPGNIKGYIKDFIEKKRDELGRTLLVTEYIFTGESIEELIDILESKNVSFDVASVSINNQLLDYSEKIKRHLYYGTRGDAGLGFYGWMGHKYSGVEKDMSIASPHPIRTMDEKKEGGVRGSLMIQEAREDVKMIAEELSKLLK